MATTFIILFIVALVHFIIESIVVPSMRMNLRYKFFEIRDRLRNAKHTYGVALDSDAYHLLEGLLNNGLKHLSSINLSVVVAASRSVNADEKLRQELQNRIDALNRCQIDEIKDIQR